MNDLIYKQEAFTIIGLCMEVHRILGPGFLEAVYKDALEYELQQAMMTYQREQSFLIPYKTTILRKKYIAISRSMARSSSKLRHWISFQMKW